MEKGILTTEFNMFKSKKFVFLKQICSKSVFQPKTEKVKITIEFNILKLVFIFNIFIFKLTNFDLKQTILLFWTKFAKKGSKILQYEIPC